MNLNGLSRIKISKKEGKLTMTDLNDVFNQLWIEKYRPKTINDVVLNKDQKEFFERCLAKKEIPHVIFYGPPGSGKTTLARILIDGLIESELDILELNGSDTTGVDSIREDIKPFLQSPPMSSRFKLVWIDEADYLSKNAQAALRNMMETYAENGRFIFTCNYQTKIIEPILSRATQFEMRTIPEDYVITFVKTILGKENVEYSDDTVKLTVSSLLPDVRKIINTIQKNVKDGKLKSIKAEDLVTIENKVLGLILELCDAVGTPGISSVTNKVCPTIQKILYSQESPDLNKLYDILFANEKLPSWAKIKVNEYANRHSSSFNEKHNFIAMVYSILYSGLQYAKLIGLSK